MNLRSIGKSQLTNAASLWRCRGEVTEFFTSYRGERLEELNQTSRLHSTITFESIISEHLNTVTGFQSLNVVGQMRMATQAHMFDCLVLS